MFRLKERWNMLIAGVDAGRSETKVVTDTQKFKFPSKILPFYEHGGEDVLKDENDMVVELLEPGSFEGQKWFVGEVTEFTEFGVESQRTEQEKATEHFKIFTLTALYRLGAMDEQPCLIGTGVPYIRFKEWGPLVKNILEKKHRIRVYKRNGVPRRTNHPHCQRFCDSRRNRVFSTMTRRIRKSASVNWAVSP